MSNEKSSKRVIPNASDGDVQTWVGLSALGEESSEEVEEVTLLDLRPRSFGDYIGQSLVKENLEIACGAAKKRSEPLDHLLLHGPPGLGKTSLAKIVARQMGVGFKATSGPVIEKPGDLAAILTSLEAGDVLFIDEIHRLPRVVEEVMYPALEDFQLDILIGQGPSAKSVRIDLKPFTLIGATTRTSLLTSPLRDRFGLVLRLHFYSADELREIITRSATLMKVKISKEAALKLGRRSRGTPRIANRLLKRVRDFAQDKADGEVTAAVADAALSMLEIDEKGLDSMDRLILTTIIEKFQGGPVGIGTIAASIGEDKATLEEVYEPFLLQEGFISRTKQGRLAMDLAYEHLGFPVTVQAKLPLSS